MMGANTRRRLALLFLVLCLVICLAAPGLACRRRHSQPTPTSNDLSTAGSLQISTLEYPNLVDSTRGTRLVPIKVHIPDTGGPYPVVVVSHGAGGDWDTHFAQAQHLASYGYAVFCVQHVGSDTSILSGRSLLAGAEAATHDSAEVLGRPKDVSFAIDRAIEWNASNPDLEGKLDIDHVGVMGHSFGAATTMMVCGIRPALDWIIPVVEPGSGLGPDLTDSRVDAGLALSPQGPGDPFFLSTSYASLKVPLLGVSGTLDSTQSGLPPTSRYDSFALWPSDGGSNCFVWLANARHLDFTDSSGSQRTMIYSPTRDDVQRIVRAAALFFFNAHLKGDLKAADSLTTAGLQPYLRGQVDEVEVRAK